MECLDVEDELFYEAINNIRNKLYYGEDEYIIIKKTEHDKILGELKSLYRDRFRQKIREVKKEVDLDK